MGLQGISQFRGLGGEGEDRCSVIDTLPVLDIMGLACGGACSSNKVVLCVKSK